MVHPRSQLAGKSIREIQFRHHYGLEPILLIRRDEVNHHDFSDTVLEQGDTLVVHGHWDRVHRFNRGDDLVLLTRVEVEESVPSKKWIAGGSFLVAIGLAVAGFPLSISLLTGALAMVLLRVLSIEDAYKAVDWRTVFLLAGLIPLGIAMDKSGAAAALAGGLAEHLANAPAILILAAVATLATLFSLFMSNVAATVLLVPLVMLMGSQTGIDPRGLALLVAVNASNSFILPTHQVNALLMGPGGYRNKDYLRSGGIMTLLFLVVSVLLVSLFYL